MSQNKFYFEGLDQLRQELRNLPRDLAGEGRHIIMGAANGAAVAVRREYHVVSGNLRDGVVVVHDDPTQFGAGAMVKSTAPHAWLYDNGSQTRKWASGKGTGKMWGRSRPTHVFVATMVRHRNAMYHELKALLERKGLQVFGNAA